MSLLNNSNNLEACRELLIQVDNAGLITAISNNCCDILEFTQNELLNTHIDSLLGCKFDDLLSNTNIQTFILKRDGQKLYFDIVSKPLMNESYKTVGFHLSLINIIKYIHIKEQYNEFIKIFERAKDMVYRFQLVPELKCEYISPSVKDILGYGVEEHYRNPNFPFELIHPDDIEIQKSKSDKHSDFSKTFCARFRHIDGHYVWLEDYLIPTFDDNGELLYISGISRDITERKKLEEKLEKQKRELELDITTEIKANKIMEETLKSQGELLVNISHELKTPVTVISSTAQLLEMYYKNCLLDSKKDAVIKYINSIKLNSYRLSKLINNLVDTSKIEEGFFELNLSNNNIVEVVEDTVMSVTNFTEIKGLNIIFDTDTEEKIIACDPEKIERIILNLISNAVKFSNRGDEILVNIKDMDELVEISVKDNGIGIDKKHLDMIFDRFKQVDKSLSRNAEGTGIGLNLVKSIVELHGGSISVESELGKGSKFIVVLPARTVTEQHKASSRSMKDRAENIKLEFSDVYM